MAPLFDRTTSRLHAWLAKKREERNQKKTLEYVAKMASATLLATGGPKPSSMTLSRFARSVLIGILQYIQSTPTNRDMHGLEVGLTPLQMQWMPTSSTIHSKCPAESYKVAGLASPW